MTTKREELVLVIGFAVILAAYLIGMGVLWWTGVISIGRGWAGSP